MLVYFWPIFPIFGAKILFTKNPALSHMGPITRKSGLGAVPRKSLDGRMDIP